MMAESVPLWVSQVLVGCVDLISEEDKCHNTRGQSEGRSLREKEWCITRYSMRGRCIRLSVRRTNDKYMTCDTNREASICPFVFRSGPALGLVGAQCLVA